MTVLQTTLSSIRFVKLNYSVCFIFVSHQFGLCFVLNSFLTMSRRLRRLLKSSAIRVSLEALVQNYLPHSVIIFSRKVEARS